MTLITDNPIDHTSKSDDQMNDRTNPTGYISPPPFYLKSPNRLNKMARFKFLPNENNPFITKLIKIIHNPILRQYKILCNYKY